MVSLTPFPVILLLIGKRSFAQDIILTVFVFLYINLTYSNFLYKISATSKSWLVLISKDSVWLNLKKYGLFPISDFFPSLIS